MTLGVLLRLSLPRTTADRVRMLLIAGATGLAGALALAGIRIARLHFEGYGDDPATVTLGPFASSSGYRPGVVLAAALLMIPPLALAVQALRMSTARRERRTRALRLAGATPAQARWFTAVEAAAAGLAGGVLAGPCYLVLWIAVGVLPPPDAALLPTPDSLDLLAWLVVAVLAPAGGLLAGYLVRRRTVDGAPGEPGPAREPDRSGVLLVVGVGIFVVATFVVDGYHRGLLSWAGATGRLAGLAVAGLGGGGLLVRFAVHRLGRSGHPLDLLAGARLGVDPRSTGRAVGVLLLCGLATGIEVIYLLEWLVLRTSPRADDTLFLSGFGLVGGGILIAALTATIGLAVPTADQIVSQRRSIAALAALGLEPGQIRSVQRRQLSGVAAAAAGAGTALGMALFYAYAWQIGSIFGHRWVALMIGCVLVAVILLSWLAAYVTVWLLRGQLRDATDPENLRTT